MRTKENIKEEIGRNILSCPRNKIRDRNHICDDCEAKNNSLRYELRGYKEGEKGKVKMILELVDRIKHPDCKITFSGGSRTKEKYDILVVNVFKQKLKE